MRRCVEFGKAGTGLVEFIIVRNLIVAASAVFGIALLNVTVLGQPAEARDRAAKSSSNSSSSHHQQSAPVSRAAASANARASTQRSEDGRFDRQCVIMECGTPWCYNVRAN